MSESPPRRTSTFHVHDTNYPVDDEGRTYHVNTKKGEVANRIITVGDANRAWLIAGHLDGVDTAAKLAEWKAAVAERAAARESAANVLPPSTFIGRNGDAAPPLFVHASTRGFLTITGRFRGVPVSIVAIGMGLAMMDFFVREVRRVTDGPLAIVRFGSCGGTPPLRAGQVVVPPRSSLILRNYDYFTGPRAADSAPYVLSAPVAADEALHARLRENLERRLAPLDSGLLPTPRTAEALNVTADSFYSSQGRQDAAFADANDSVLELVTNKLRDTVSIEMETFMLYHLARCTPAGSAPIRAAACMMVFFERMTGVGISAQQIEALETAAGLGILEALAGFS